MLRRHIVLLLLLARTTSTGGRGEWRRKNFSLNASCCAGWEKIYRPPYCCAHPQIASSHSARHNWNRKMNILVVGWNSCAEFWVEAASIPRNWKLKLQSTNAFTSDRATNGTGPSERETKSLRAEQMTPFYFYLRFSFSLGCGEAIKWRIMTVLSRVKASPGEAKPTSKKDFYAPFPPFRLCTAPRRRKVNEINFYFMPFTGPNKYITINRAHRIQGIFVAVINRPSGCRRNCFREKTTFGRFRTTTREVRNVSISDFTFLGAGLKVTSGVCVCSTRFINIPNSSIENVENFSGNFILLGIAQNPFENFQCSTTKAIISGCSICYSKGKCKTWFRIECAEMINFILDSFVNSWSCRGALKLSVTSIILNIDNIELILNHLNDCGNDSFATCL